VRPAGQARCRIVSLLLFSAASQRFPLLTNTFPLADGFLGGSSILLSSLGSGTSAFIIFWRHASSWHLFHSLGGIRRDCICRSGISREQRKGSLEREAYHIVINMLAQGVISLFPRSAGTCGLSVGWIACRVLLVVLRSCPACILTAHIHGTRGLWS
jgi:hypothetical protein